MSLFALILLAFGMSMDAFSAAIAKGTTAKHISLLRALRYGLVFGAAEAIAPVIGYVLGQAAREWIGAYDHWLAFGLLSVLGVRCLYQAWRGDDEEATQKGGVWLVLTAVATSIDAAIVGVSLAFLQVNIYLAAAVIGITSTLMSTLGLYLGRRLGERFGALATAAGGVVLIGIGAMILYTHLTGAA